MSEYDFVDLKALKEAGYFKIIIKILLALKEKEAEEIEKAKK